MITRRAFAFRMGLAAAVFGLGGTRAARAGWSAGLGQTLVRIEADSGGRLGVGVLDTGDGTRAGHRLDECFPLCSTFKVLASGAVLARVDAGQEDLARRVRFTAADLVPYSPITKDRVGGDGMTLAEIAAAAIDYSDNTAGNLLLAQIGGPNGLTRFVRTLGDPVTRLDRTETALNEAAPGDPRDTTTPGAMLADLHALLLGSALSAAGRDHLLGWLKANTTGALRLKAGLPADWTIGDKTGAGDRGTTNDVGILWPPGRAPVLVTAYLTGTEAPVERRNAAIAAVGRAVADALTQ